MKIFHNGTKQYSAEKFTLAYKGTILRNEDTLASIYTPGEQLVIDVHSIEITVRHQSGSWQFPLTVMATEIVNSKLEQFIKGVVYSQKSLMPDKVAFQQIINGAQYGGIYGGNLVPESVVIVVG